jgi:hypothetical protein
MPRAVLAALFVALPALAQAEAPAQQGPGPIGEQQPVLPFLGAAAAKMGIGLPLPVGLTLLGQLQREEILVRDLHVGLGGAPLIDSAFVSFGGVTTRVQNLLVRGDVWILPFLNIYGVAGGTWESTTVHIQRPLDFTTVQDSHGLSIGFGGTLAWGIEPYGFITVDANVVWTDLGILNQPQRTVTLTPRLGHRFVSNTNKDRALSLWAGLMLEDFQGRVVGNIPFAGLLPGTATAGIPLPADFAQWLTALSPEQQRAVEQLLIQLTNLGAKPDAANARTDFDLVIATRRSANLIVGGEMQLSEHWQIRAEGGFLGTRTNVLGSLTWRFAL